MTGKQLEAIHSHIRERGSTGYEAMLLEEIERLAGQLSDCWLLLDSVARIERGIGAAHCADSAAKLLRKQNVPGWKTGS